MSDTKCKSVFGLHVYKYCGYGEKLAYQISAIDLNSYGHAIPGISITDEEIGYFQTLNVAEKHIKRIADENREDLHSFVIEEMPLDHIIDNGDCLSSRRYLSDGSLWQVGEITNIPIPFKVGDIVEIAYKNFVELAIVLELPETSDDSYIAIDYSVAKDGEINFVANPHLIVDVLPTKFPVPEKMALQLRECLKYYQELKSE